jgi:glycosyltransferase involved in cell wall biosynthesis
MKILTYWTHESFQTNLAKTGHEFYNLPSPNRPNGWNLNSRPLPVNMIPISLEDAKTQAKTFDLLLTQSDMQWFISDWWHGKRLHLEHTTYPQEMDPYWKCPSVFITEYNKKMWKEGPKGYKSTVIRHAIDIDEWPKWEGNFPDVLTVANSFRKRDWCLGYSFFEWVTKNFRVVILGNDNEDIKNHRVLSSSNWSEVKMLYEAYGVYFNSSLHSPVPMSVLEAMAVGMPVVSTNTCELPYYIKSYMNGVISDNPDELSFALNRILSDKEFGVKLGNNARETVAELCNTERFVGQWQKVLEEVV